MIRAGMSGFETFTSKSCQGEKCMMCGSPAAAKVSEVIPFDDPAPYRHKLTAYVCQPHFEQIMGGPARRDWR